MNRILGDDFNMMRKREFCFRTKFLGFFHEFIYIDIASYFNL